MCSKITVLSLLLSQNTVNTSIFKHFLFKKFSPVRERKDMASFRLALNQLIKYDIHEIHNHYLKPQDSQFIILKITETTVCDDQTH